MNKIIRLGIVGLLLALAVAPARASTTNYWVQNVSIKVVAYVQVKERVLHGSLSTKQFLAFLSGITNPALASVKSVGPATNYYATNLTVEVTNLWLLPNTANPPGDLPRSYTVTSDYVVTPDNGVTFYTNNINFTNDVIVTRGGTTNPFYTFINSVTVPTNRTAYLFPGLPASSVSATWTNHGPGTVFVLNGYVQTNSIGTATNYSYAANPDFTKLPGTKLLLVTPIIDGTNYPSRYVVRYKSGKQDVDVDVGSFLAEYSGNPYVSVVDTIYPGAPPRVYAYDGVDFNNQNGTSFSFVGFDTQVWSVPSKKGFSVTSALLKQRKLEANNYAGYISGQIQDRSFSYAPTVVRGSITISGGKVE